MHTLTVFVNRLQTLRGAAWRAGQNAPLPHAAEVQPKVLADEAQTESEAQACGWFDSSHALHCGLHVTEHTSPDTLATHLPLDAWLELHLAGRIAAPAVRAD